MVQKIENLELFERIREDLFDKIVDYRIEIKSLDEALSKDYMKMCSAQYLAELKLERESLIDNVNMLLKSYAVITTQLTNIALS
jgi:DNA repair exonuclease SbcCD ATPase subunit